MMCELQTSDVIATLAALLACLSALYARWSAIEAKHANNIAKHTERLLIYKALLKFKSVLVVKGEKFSEEDLWSFDDAVQLSEFFYKKSIFKQLEKIRDDAFQVQSYVELYKITKLKGSDEYNALLKKTRTLNRQTREKCTEIAENLKKELRIGDT